VGGADRRWSALSKRFTDEPDALFQLLERCEGESQAEASNPGLVRPSKAWLAISGSTTSNDRIRRWTTARLQTCITGLPAAVAHIRRKEESTIF